ncbi:MAG: ethanolamine ammonia-lyase subunit EutC [Caldilineales bacterium]|nr:ethanolamine ammonia-lyase subunit EutC [Caldilineales bacterium]
MDDARIEAIVQAVLAELGKETSAPRPSAAPAPAPTSPPAGDLVIDLPDPTRPEARRALGVAQPFNAEGLRNLCATTTARLGVGRAGPRPKTRSLLLFQADHGVTQDAIYSEVAEEVKARFQLFTVQTQVQDRGQYLLRPDLGRKLSDEARRTINERCAKGPQVQIVIGDGLSAAAVANNLAQIYPVIEQGLKAAGIRTGTPFFVRFARVGVINDINEIVGADLVLLLIGERPGLGVADALSAYMGYRPGPGKTDAHRDVICMITNNGGINPLEAGAYVVELIKKTLEFQASGVELKLKTAGK